MSGTLLTVDIPVDGEFPNPRELALREKIEKDLAVAKVGTLVGSGSGLGAMDLSYLVEDEALGRSLIERAIRRHLPNADYSIDSEFFEGDLAELLEDQGEWPVGRLMILAILVAAILVLLAISAWRILQ